MQPVIIPFGLVLFSLLKSASGSGGHGRLETEDHSISKRFIYPKNSILQFALALVLPAEVVGRGIATNTGIILNINLPTNISEFRVPYSGLSKRFHKNILSAIRNNLDMNGLDGEACLLKCACLLSFMPLEEESLITQLLKIFLLEFEDYAHFTKNPTKKLNKLLSTSCSNLNKTCPFVDSLFGV